MTAATTEQRTSKKPREQAPDPKPSTRPTRQLKIPATSHPSIIIIAHFIAGKWPIAALPWPSPPVSAVIAWRFARYLS